VPTADWRGNAHFNQRTFHSSLQSVMGPCSPPSPISSCSFPRRKILAKAAIKHNYNTNKGARESSQAIVLPLLDDLDACYAGAHLSASRAAKKPSNFAPVDEQKDCADRRVRRHHIERVGSSRPLCLFDWVNWQKLRLTQTQQKKKSAMALFARVLFRRFSSVVTTLPPNLRLDSATARYLLKREVLPRKRRYHSLCLCYRPAVGKRCVCSAFFVFLCLFLARCCSRSDHHQP
jgi:hypothetical protein